MSVRLMFVQVAFPVLILGSLWRVPALSDGCYFEPEEPEQIREVHGAEREPVSSPGQKAVILQDAGSEILLLQTTYRGPSSGFAWVIPVPGVPGRSDVFMANPKVFEQLEAQTRPQREVIIRDPLTCREWSLLEFLSLRRMFENVNVNSAMPPTAGAPAAPPPPRVIVYERMEVGDYDVSILSATGRGVLVDWLNRNGYVFPRRAEPIVDDYVTREWCFVALRVRPAIQQGQPLLADVAPIGIRFTTQSLVYPLTISRINAPAMTVLQLLVVADSGVKSVELPTVTFPTEMKGKQGVTYERLARDLLAKGSGRALLCEGRQALALSVDLDKEMKRRLLPGNPKHYTRFWAGIQRDSMKDLTFAPVPESPFSLHIEQSASVWVPTLARLCGTQAGRILCVLASLAATWWGLWLVRKKLLASGKSEVSKRLGRTLSWSVGLFCVAVCFFTIGRFTGMRLTDLAHIASDWQWLLFVLFLLFLPAGLWCFGCAAMARQLVSDEVPCAAAGCTFLTVFLVAPAAIPSVHAACNAVIRGLDPPTVWAARETYSDSIRTLETALKGFRSATGAYPERLTDLTLKKAPSRGLDASGNRVPITASPKMPVLRTIPDDSLSGRNDTWVYDVRSPYLVQSGEYTVTVTTRTTG